MPEPFLLRYMQPLLAGRRAECFTLVQTALQDGAAADELICDVVWPATLQVDRLYRDDRITIAIEHMATRINRTVVDQLQAALPAEARHGRRALICCADTAGEELGAQMIADLFQANGWDVFFPGGGVPDDELLSLVGHLRPTVLIIFGAQPEAVPNTRALIERIRGIDACPTMNVIVTGGIFSRADGLWREVGADAFRDHPRVVLETANTLGPRKPHAAAPVGLVKKRRRRRKSAGGTTAEVEKAGAAVAGAV